MSRSYPDDAEQYTVKCGTCGKDFVGHKDRSVCRACKKEAKAF